MKLEERMLRSIKQRRGIIILRADVAKFGSASQVSAVLRALLNRGVIVRIGMGVYAKTRKSSITGATIPAGSLESLAVEALKRMGVTIAVGRAGAAYNAGSVTQLPGAFVANTGSRRISRKITVGGRSVKYENNHSRAPIED